MILGREGGNGAAVAGDTLMGLSWWWWWWWWWWCVVIAWTTRLSIALLCSALLCSSLLSIALHCSALLVADVAGQGGGARDVGTIRARLAHDGWHAATVSMAEVTAVHASAILDVDRRRSTWCSRRPGSHAVFPPVTRSRDFIAFVPNWVVPTGLYRANRRIWGAFRSSEPRKPPPRPLIRSNS